MKKVTVLRAVSGAGKTTLAQNLMKRHLFANVGNESVGIISTDDFWMVDGKYQFDPNRLGEAHGSTLRHYIRVLQNETFREVIVDNTNTRVSEMAPYVAIAQAYGYDVEIITLRCDPQLAASRNIHGVPNDIVMKMAENLDKETAFIPPWWKHTIQEV